MFIQILNFWIDAGVGQRNLLYLLKKLIMKPSLIFLLSWIQMFYWGCNWDIYLFGHDCQCILFVLYFLHLCQKLQTAVKAPLNQVDRVYAAASTNLWGVVCARNLHISAFLPQFLFWNKLIFKIFSLSLAPCYSDYFRLTHCRLTCD